MCAPRPYDKRRPDVCFAETFLAACFVMKAKPQPNLEIRPLTPQLWPALADLFGPLGACNGCWCIYGRIGAAYRKRPRKQNKAAFREIVKKGPPPGLLAFDGDLAVGWCQLTPRDAVPHLDHLWRLKRVDDAPVWCMSCFYVRIAYRELTRRLFKRRFNTLRRQAHRRLKRILLIGACRQVPRALASQPPSSALGSERLLSIHRSARSCG